MLIISYLYNLSERQTEEVVNFQLPVKEFVGHAVDPIASIDLGRGRVAPQVADHLRLLQSRLTTLARAGQLVTSNKVTHAPLNELRSLGVRRSARGNTFQLLSVLG